MKARMTGAVAAVICLLLTLGTLSVRAQNVTVSNAVTGNGSYVDLASAFAAINGGSQTSANIVVNIIANTTETTSAVLNANNWSSLLIQPSGGGARSVSGAIAGPLVDLNGVSAVTINGLNSGGNSLSFMNTDVGNVLTTTLRFVNGAFSNVVANASFYGGSPSPTLGVITFSGSTGTGNNNNHITTSNIGPAPGALPANGLYSAGSATSANTTNTVSLSNVFDYFQSAVATAGILLDANNEGWTITGNRLYQGGTRTYTVSNTHRGISVNSGSGHVITGNIIGYASSAGTGVTGMASTTSIRYIGIQLGTGTLAATSVQGNTVTAINFTSSSTASTANGVLCGLHITSGSMNAGNIAGNVFGGTSGTDLLHLSTSGSGGMVVGFAISTTGTVLLQNNSMGGFSSVGTTAGTGSGISGINLSVANGSLTIITNTIGNTTANNMRAGTSGITTGATNVSGMNLSSVPTGTAIVSGNIIRNLTGYGSGSGYVRGLWTATGGTAVTYSITGNLFTNFNSNGTATGISNGQTGMVGINLSTGINGVVMSNTITNLSLLNTGVIANIAAGITHGNAQSSRIGHNVIYNINSASTATASPPVAAGVIVRSGTNDLTIDNNMISLGSGNPDNTTYIGIQGNHGSTPNPSVMVYFNTINISGAVTTGTNPTFGIHRGDLTTSARSVNFTVRNNLVTNTRSGGSGSHYAIGNNWGNTTAPAAGWSSNFNVLNASASTVGHWTSSQTMAGWQAASGGDNNSYSGIAVTYVNAATDLHLNMGTTPTYIESGGQVISGITTDIDGQVRPGPSGSTLGGAMFPDIGADEIDAAPVTCTTAVGGAIAPASGTACAGQVLTVSSTGASGAFGTTYQWMVSNVPGGPYTNVSGGSGATTTSYTSAALPTGTFYVIMRAMCAAASVTNSTNEATLTVYGAPSSSAGIASQTVCSSSTFTLTGASNTGTSYLWKGPSGQTYTTQNVAVTNAQLFAGGAYSLITKNANCSSTMAVVNVTVLSGPASITVAPVSPSICAGDSAVLVTGQGRRPVMANFTPQTNSNTPTTYPAPYTVYYGGQKMQFLVLASELTAAGLTSGALTGIQFPVISMGSNWGTSLTGLQNFQVSVGHTNLTSLVSTFVAGLTVVSPVTTYTPQLGFNNLHEFTTPFVWDGVSNVVIETAFSNNITGTSNDAVIQYYHSTSFPSTILYRADNQTFATITAATTTNQAVVGVRPDFRLHGHTSTPFVWSPSTGLSATNTSTVRSSPAATTPYTVSTQNGPCMALATATVNVTQPPSLSVFAVADSVCAGDSVSLVASGANSYTWSTQGTSSVITVQPASNTVYTVSALHAPCPVVSETVAVSVIPLPNVNVTPSSATLCVGEVATFSASGASFYLWSTNSMSDTTMIPVLDDDTVLVVGVEIVGSLFCFNLDTAYLYASPLPTLSISASAQTVCAGTPVTFTASGASTYSWNNGPNTAVKTFTALSSGGHTVTGTNAQGCKGQTFINLNVNALPTVSAAAGDGTICVGETTTLQANGALTYSWLPGNVPGTTFTVNGATAGSLTYTVTGVDGNQCVNTATVSLLVDLCTSLAQQELMRQVKLFPNPSNGQFTIAAPVDGLKHIRVLSATGQLLYDMSSAEQQIPVDMRTFAKGLYYVEVSVNGEALNYRVLLD